MNKQSGNVALTISGAIAMVLAASAAQAQATSPTNLEAVVVTAQKREETLLKVPQSVTVLGEAQLERLHATTFADYLALVPGLSLQQSTPGQSRVIMRGVNAGSVASTVGIYVDETPFGSSTSLANAGILSGDFDTFDVARVEVLRGPQGTLYGSNSLSGVIKYVTNPPRIGEFEGRVAASTESTDGGNSSYSGNAMLNVPLGDKAALRASGFYREHGGFIDAIGRVDSDINGSKSSGGRLSAWFVPNDEVSMQLTAIAQNIRSEDDSTFDADPLTLASLNGELSRTQFRPDHTDTDYRLYNATINWDFGSANLTSVTSFGKLDQGLNFDGTLILGGLAQALYGVGGLYENQTLGQDKFTQEIRLASPSSNKTEWLIGAYYSKEDARLFQEFIPFDLATLADVSSAFAGFPFLVNLVLDSDYEELAAFGGVTWNLTDRVELSIGGRFSSNDQNSSQFIDGALLALQGQPAPQLTIGKSSEDVFTWSVAPRFAINDRTSIYLRVAEGYRPGGPNVVPPGAGPEYPVQFSSDSVISYEAGIKAQSASNRVGLEAAVYYQDWSDILIFAAFASAIGPVGANDNGQGAKSVGAEVTVTLRPTEGLNLSINGAYNDSQLKGDTPPVTGGLDGDTLPFSPKLTASVSGDYEWSVFGDKTAFAGTTLRYVGDQVAGFDSLYRAIYGARAELPSYTTIDARIGLTAGKWTLTAYANNLGNETGYTNLSGFGTRPVGPVPAGAILAAPIRPRTYGLSIGASF